MGKKHFIGKRVKAFRMKKEMTQPQLAILLGVSLSTIERIEAGGSISDLTHAKIVNRMQNNGEREAVAA